MYWLIDCLQKPSKVVTTVSFFKISPCEKHLGPHRLSDLLQYQRVGQGEVLLSDTGIPELASALTAFIYHVYCLGKFLVLLWPTTQKEISCV